MQTKRFQREGTTQKILFLYRLLVLKIYLPFYKKSVAVFTSVDWMGSLKIGCMHNNYLH